MLRPLLAFPCLLAAAMAQDAPNPRLLAPARPTGVLVSPLDADGCIWVRGERYKLGLSAAGASFRPLFGPRAPRDYPLDLSLAAVAIGGVDQPLANGEWQAEPDHFVRKHGGVDECWRCTTGGAQHFFEVARPDRTGALSLRIAATSALSPDDRGPGVTFAAPGLGSVNYGDAVVCDARGARLEIPVQWTGEALVIDVPASFTATAQWPLLVDPLVTTFAVDTTVSDMQKPRVACEPTSGNWLVVAEEVLSATDSDLITTRYAGDGTLLDVAYAENGTDRVNNPDVGFLASTHQFVVGWHVASGNGSFKTRSRLATATTQTNTVTVTSNIGTDLGCQVRIGSALFGSTTLIAVLRRVSGMASIMVSLRTSTGANLGNQFVVNLTTAGGGTFDLAGLTTVTSNSDRWVLAWQECTAASCSARAVYMQAVSTTSTLFLGSLVTLVTATGIDHAAFAGAGGKAFAVWDGPGLGSPDIFGVPVGGSGTLYNGVGSPQNLTLQEPSAVLSRTQSAPTVSYDGVRFVYGYLEDDGTGTQRPYAATIAVDSGLSTAWHEGHLQLSNAMTRNLCLGPGALADPGVHCAVFQEDGAGGQGDVGAAFLDARSPGGTSTVAQTGCGLPVEPTISLTGTPALGRTITFDVAVPTGFPLLMVGVPVSIPLLFCGTCTAGVDPSSMQVFGGPSLPLTVPTAATLVGATLAVQSLVLLQTGGCPATLLGFDFAVSDTITITVR